MIYRGDSSYPPKSTHTMPCIIKEAVDKPTSAVIFLHGLGDSPLGWVFLAETARRSNRLRHVRFVFPEAPQQPLTLNYGMVLSCWYDIIALSNVHENEDEDGILRSYEILKNLIQEVHESGIKMENIVIAGFSQGCALTLLSAHTLNFKIGGFIGLSGYTPLPNYCQKHSSIKNLNTPTLIIHGQKDQAIIPDLAHQSLELLKEKGFNNVSLTLYLNLTHSANPEETEAILSFLESII